MFLVTLSSGANGQEVVQFLCHCSSNAEKEEIHMKACAMLCYVASHRGWSVTNTFLAFIGEFVQVVPKEEDITSRIHDMSS